MLHRVLAFAACSLFHPPVAAPVRPAMPLEACLVGVRGPLHNGQRMTSGIEYATVLPVVAHRTLPLGSIVDVRFGGRVARGIVLDNQVMSRRLGIEVSPLLARRLAVLPDRAEPVTLEVVGQEPRSRWIHAIGALTP